MSMLPYLAASIVAISLSAQSAVGDPAPPPPSGAAQAQGIPVLERELDAVKTRTPIPGKPVRFVRVPTSSVRIDQKKPYLRIYYWPPVAPEDAASAPNKGEAPQKVLASGVTLDPIYFPFNESEFVAPSSHLAGIADWLKSDPTNAVTLTGHADPRGTKARNNTISLERAQTVKAALIKLGAPEAQIFALGKGSSSPVHKGKTAESNHWGSRRVEPYLHSLKNAAEDAKNTAGQAADKPNSNHS